MTRKRKRDDREPPAPAASKSPDVLPRRALERINLGQAFAEYDNNLTKGDIFVRTPAMSAALDHESPQFIFVGRRGTGKTTIVKYLEEHQDRILSIRPEIFSPNGSLIDIDLFKDMAQRPFRSLVAAFRRSLQDEALFAWLDANPGKSDRLSPKIVREYNDNSEFDFDIRTVRFIAALTRPLRQQDEIAWLTEVKFAKNLAADIPNLAGRDRPYSIVIDAIDDFWDGTIQAVYYLTALLHAALEVNSQVPGVRVLIFLRENMFERVRIVDSEFSRIETCVVGLDWTTNQLREMIERRINAPLPSKLELGGKTWNAFFEDGESAREAVFGFCQSRPRDVLTYCTLALTTAQSNRHTRVMLEDLQEARRRFSDNRLKDLSDEYQENYPQIGLVLSRFWGLGAQFTLGGFEDFLHKLTEDDEVVSGCNTWLFQHNTPELLARLLYNIGFVGLVDQRRGPGKAPTYRSTGPKDTTPPPVSDNIDIVIHPTYRVALDMHDGLISSLVEFNKRKGLLIDLPDSIQDFQAYKDRLSILQDDLKTTPQGHAGATNFEQVVGDVLRLCLFRPLHNVAEQVTEVDGTIRRDWVASNRANSGFWEVMRQRYSATQVVFECKNYGEIGSADFQQAAYYMTKAAGMLVFLVFRGQITKHHYGHVKRIHGEKDGLVILLTDRDLAVFIRQSMIGKVKDDHLQARYDETVRAIS